MLPNSHFTKEPSISYVHVTKMYHVRGTEVQSSLHNTMAGDINKSTNLLALFIYLFIYLSIYLNYIVGFIKIQKRSLQNGEPEANAFKFRKIKELYTYVLHNSNTALSWKDSTIN